MSGRTHVVVVDVSQQPELPVSPLGVDQGLEGSIQLLDGHLLLRLLVYGRATEVCV